MSAKKYKVVFLGDESAGKTSLVRRYMYGTFEEDVQATIGMDFQSKTVVLDDGRSVRLQLWDTAGQERFRSLIPSYIRDAAAAVVVYDITKRQSFDDVERWLSELRDHAEENIVVLLVGNKSDLKHLRAVSTQEASEFADKQGLAAIETSALDSSNVDVAFHRILSDIYNAMSKRQLRAEAERGASQNIQVDAEPTQQRGSKCCA